MTRPTYPGDPEPPARRGGDAWAATPGGEPPRGYPPPSGAPAASRQEQQGQGSSRWRRRPLWQRALGVCGVVVLLVGGGVVIGWRATMADTFRALRIVHGVPAGGKLNPGDLETIEVPTDLREEFLPARRTQEVLRKTAKVDLREGSLLRRHQLSDAKGLPRRGQLEVGLALGPGQVPADGLGVGDTVRVVAGVPTGNGVEVVTLAGRASVYEVRQRGKTIRVTLLTGRQAADRIGAYAGNASISLVRTDRGGGGPDKPVVWDPRPSEKPKDPTLVPPGGSRRAAVTVRGASRTAALPAVSQGMSLGPTGTVRAVVTGAARTSVPDSGFPPSRKALARHVLEWVG